MSEKLAEVYEQYNMEILSSQKGRGGTILNTEQGLRILEPFRGNVTRLEREHVLKQLLEEAGCDNVDSIIPNRDGLLFTCDKYRQPFVLKKHFEGEECDMREPEDLVRAVRALGKFHIFGRQVTASFDDSWNKVLQEKEQHRMEEIRQALENGEELERLASLYEISEAALRRAMTSEEDLTQDAVEPILTMDEKFDERDDGIEDLFVRHNREMKRIQKYIRTVKRKNTFEKMYMEVYEEFYGKGEQCVKMLREIPVSVKGETGKNSGEHYGICHGSFNQHNIILGEETDALVHFEKFTRGNQLNDLYQFARKVMEKNNFDFELLEKLLDTYKEYIPLNSSDYCYIYILFSYPEKFWKIANGYYNASKAFLSPKYSEKLEVVILQENEKQGLLQRYREKNKLFN